MNIIQRLRWSLGRGNPVVPSRWQATVAPLNLPTLPRRVCSHFLGVCPTHPVTVKGHFRTEQAALKTRYLITRSMDPKGTGQARWVTRWKPALNALAVTFADRMPAAENL
jgi:hypothetical protein